MTLGNDETFGNNFVPGKDKDDPTAASKALTQRWSGRPGVAFGNAKAKAEGRPQKSATDKD